MTIFGFMHLLSDIDDQPNADRVSSLESVLGEMDSMAESILDELATETALPRRRRLMVRLEFIRNQQRKGRAALAEQQAALPLAAVAAAS